MVLQSLACGFEINGNVSTWLCVGLGLHHRPVRQSNSNWYEPWRTNSGAPGKAHPSGGGMRGTIRWANKLLFAKQPSGDAIYWPT